MSGHSIQSIVCCTSNSALTEPRASKFVAALSEQFPNARITYIDASPTRVEGSPMCISRGSGAVLRKTCTFPTRRTGVSALASARFAQQLSRCLYRLFKIRSERLISIVAPRFRRQLSMEEFDLIVGHSIDLLPMMCDLGRSRGAKLVFDSMEFHSDMGDGQSNLVRRVVREIEAAYLPQCDLVFASSPEVAEAIEQHYGVESVVPLYNAAPVTNGLSSRLDDGRLHLYWRNATVGMSQRGLGDALEALTYLPDDVVLNVQGRPGSKLSMLRRRVADLDLEGRVIIHAAFRAGDAVRAASPYSIGLCPERDTCANQRLTVSNKIFDYLMAGLAVVSSNLPGLAAIIEDSGAGVLYRAGDARDLADRIQSLRDDPDLLRRLQRNARSYSTTHINEASQLELFGDEIDRLALQS